MKFTSLLVCIYLMGAIDAWGQQSTPTEFGPNPELAAPEEKWLPTLHVATAKGWGAYGAPQGAPGTQVSALARGLQHPRWLYVLPNGDVLVAEADAPVRPDDGKGIAGKIGEYVMKRAGSGRASANQITLLRDSAGDGRHVERHEFLQGLNSPIGMALIGNNLYVADSDALLRFPYKTGDTEIRAQSMLIATLPGGTINHHWTKSLIASADGKKLYVGVGSKANVADDDSETNRADVLEFNPDGTGQRIYAAGVRNASGLAMHPQTGQLWVAVNERDALGDDLVPDYVTHIQESGFYGWPWYYTGPNQDPRFAGKRPDLKEKVIVPDVLLQSHSAPLTLTFYEGKQFPAEYQGDLFVTSHGSWNRAHRTGYKVMRVFTPNGKATGEYEDFVTGFVVNDANVWGRPVGVTVASDGSLVFTDDASNSVWRVTYTGKPTGN